jgi:hypothetical protein
MEFAFNFFLCANFLITGISRSLLVTCPVAHCIFFFSFYTFQSLISWFMPIIGWYWESCHVYFSSSFGQSGVPSFVNFICRCVGTNELFACKIRLMTTDWTNQAASSDKETLHWLHLLCMMKHVDSNPPKKRSLSCETKRSMLQAV